MVMEKQWVLNQVQSMRNPMENLIDVMRRGIVELGIAENADALDELDKAAEHIRKAVDLATKQVFKL
jgi:chaperonin cofactor prefoldin